MQTNSLTMNQFWTMGTTTTLPGFALNLVLAAIMAFLVGQAYIRFGHALSNRRLFARNFLLLTLTTTLIISIVKSSLALSLGLVGALSIVRFRAAIKEPEELAYLFLAISIGLGLGADQALITCAACAIILLIVGVQHFFRRTPAQPNLYLTVSSPGPGKVTAGQILDAFKEAGATASLKRLDETPDRLEASFLVDFEGVSQMEDFNRSLRELNGQVTVSYLEERGLAL
jgi:uncharacterized membrane protein YhiD involved in acid resistance